jgi:transglutaminase-like putative cysteine protease
MRLSVRHATAYAFDTPKRFVTQSHRLTPFSCEQQQVIDWTVSSEGAVFGASFTDGAGETVTTMTLQGPVDRVEIVVEGEVETNDTAGVLRGHRETISPRVYLGPTQAIKANGALLDLAADALRAAKNPDELATAHLLSAAVSKAIEYVPGSTGAHTTAAEALEQGRGVCQDQAHALIALAQSREMPARYVSGYLLARDDGAAEDATHAWAEIHVPGLGWVGFDPANECCPDARYIRLGSGRDALAAAPIRGVSRGAGAETMDVTVSVAAQQQQRQQ